MSLLRDSYLTPISYEDDLKKNPKLKMEDDIASLRSWYSKQNHLPPITDKELLLFLYSCHCSIEQTKITLDKYFTCRTHCPEIFENRDPFKVTVMDGQFLLDTYMLPGITPNDDRVVFVRLRETNPVYFDFAECSKSFVMTCDLEHHYYGTSKGFVIAFDMAGIQFGHVLKLNVGIMKKILYYLQDAMPVRLTGLHFLNTVPFMDRIIAIMKPFLKKELWDNLRMHSSDLTEFYKAVPQSMLPSDYTGGKNLSVNELAGISLELRQKHADWFKEKDARSRVDESKRPGAPMDSRELWGMEGSFKKLDLD